MKRTVLYIAASLDGYIATADHSVSWLDDLENPDGNDYGYMNFLEGIDTLIMGRKTYEVIKGFGIEWPYKGCETYVVTSKKDFAVHTPDTHVLSAELPSALKSLTDAPGDKGIWVLGGGQTVNSLLDLKAIDEIMLFTAPVLLGRGVPLFPDREGAIKLKLKDQKAYPSGMVFSHYKVSYS